MYKYVDARKIDNSLVALSHNLYANAYQSVTRISQRKVPRAKDFDAELAHFHSVPHFQTQTDFTGLTEFPGIAPVSPLADCLRHTMDMNTVVILSFRDFCFGVRSSEKLFSGSMKGDQKSVGCYF
jgi:hypothetical protein